VTTEKKGEKSSLNKHEGKKKGKRTFLTTLPGKKGKMITWRISRKKKKTSGKIGRRKEKKEDNPPYWEERTYRKLRRGKKTEGKRTVLRGKGILRPRLRKGKYEILPVNATGGGRWASTPEENLGSLSDRKKMGNGTL